MPSWEPLSFDLRERASRCEHHAAVIVPSATQAVLNRSRIETCALACARERQLDCTADVHTARNFRVRRCTQAAAEFATTFARRRNRTLWTQTKTWKHDQGATGSLSRANRAIATARLSATWGNVAFGNARSCIVRTILGLDASQFSFTSTKTTFDGRSERP